MLAPGEIRALRGRAEPAPGPTPEQVRSAFEPELARAWQALQDELSADSGLGRIAVGADLSDVEVAVLALCGAVELDETLGGLCAVANDNPALGFVTAGLVARVLGPDGFAALAENARLRCAALVEVDDDASLASARVWLARPAAWALTGMLSFGPQLPVDSEIVLTPQSDGSGARRLLVTAEERTRRVQGAVAAARGAAFLVTRMPRDENGWRAVVCHASVAGLGIVLDLQAPDELDGAGRRWISQADHLTWALCCAHPVALESLPAEPWTDVAAGVGETTDGEWRVVFGDAPLPAHRPLVGELRLASMVAQPGEDPQRAIRRVGSGTLHRHARRVVPQVGWDDLVLPPALDRQLRELVNRYRQRTLVHDQWRLPLYPSPGVVTLFSGPSGTGKTTTAEVIAGDLGIDLFRVDLSALVSKYIGETEKNLEEIFSAAHAGNFLLLFDEADALFGARSQVTDARDRYANMEVSYLLQRLESYDGFVVLTSNLQGNIDPAFLRRIHVTVHFAMPTPAERRRIWTRSLGDAPRHELDLDFVADKFDMSGGAIRNAALTAAFLAAGNDGSIGMVELLRAIRQEMAKLGRRASDDQFGSWLPLLAQAAPDNR